LSAELSRHLPRLAGVTPAALADLVRSVAHDVLTGHGLDPAALPATVTVQRPRDSKHGDYATNVALQTATKAGIAPREFAGWLALELAQRNVVSSADVAGPGFLNLRLGADARGEILAQVLAAGESFGTSQDSIGCDIEVLIGRTVSLLLQAAEVRIRQRAGTLMTIADLADVVGMDAARYAVIRSSYVSPIDIDLELWSRWTNDNPVFSVQYAHARLASLARNAVDLGISPENAQLGLLDHVREGELICTLGEFPQIVTCAAQLCEPYRIARYLEDLTSAYEKFSDTCPILPLGEEPPEPRHAARQALCGATRQVLANGLSLLGVSAPERL
jgi:arginyl-tRNA synthetase